MNISMNVTAYGFDSDVARSIMIKQYRYIKTLKQLSEETQLSVNTIQNIMENGLITKKTNQKLLSWAKKQKEQEKNYKGEKLELI